jgi:long-chain acyl-CoA synthetase
MQAVSGVPGFWRWSVEHPDAPAAIDVDGRTWSYGELGDRVDRTSRWLQSIGIGAGDPVAIVAGNSVGFLAATLAAAQVGVRYTLVNRHLAPPEIDYIVHDCGARLVVTDTALAPVVGGLGVPAVALDAGSGLDVLTDVIADQPPGSPADRVAGSIMLYTSGTSGRPKGVQSTVAATTPEEAADRAAYVLRRFGIDPSAAVGTGVHLVTSPLYHSAPIANATLALHLGHLVVVMPRFDAATSLELIARHAVTWTHVVPTMMKRWLELPAERRASIDVSTVRWLIHAAAPCPPAVKRAIIEWFGPVVYEYYSSTEVGGTAITSAEWLTHPGSVGRPWAGADVRILDDDGHELPPDTVGAIWMRNVRPFVYHNDPDKTAANRRGDYVTVGDLGSLDADGFLYLADRRTDLILSGGVNVYPAEIEAALLAHPGVADAAVVGIPDTDLGEVVHAVVCPLGSDAGLVDALHAHLAAELARFKRPRTIELRDALPRSETGKLLRRVLRDEIAASGNVSRASPRASERGGSAAGD